MKNSLLLSLLLLAGTTGAFSNTISVSPASQTVFVGQTFSVNIDIDHFPDLYSYQFNLNFDPTVLAANSIAEGPLFPGSPNSFFLPGIVDNSTGSIAFTVDTLLLPGINVDGPGTIAIAEFTAIGAGTTSLDFSDVLFYDSSVFANPFPTPLPATTASGTVDVAPADEPATLSLLATALGLLGLGMWRRSKRGAETVHS